MNIRSEDEVEAMDILRSQRRKSIADSPLAVSIGLIGAVIAVASALYSIFGVKFQTDQNTVEIIATKNWIERHGKMDSEHNDVMATKIDHMSEQLNQAIGKLDEIDKRIK